VCRCSPRISALASLNFTIAKRTALANKFRFPLELCACPEEAKAQIAEETMASTANTRLIFTSEPGNTKEGEVMEKRRKGGEVNVHYLFGSLMYSSTWLWVRIQHGAEPHVFAVEARPLPMSRPSLRVRGSSLVVAASEQALSSCGLSPVERLSLSPIRRATSPMSGYFTDSSSLATKNKCRQLRVLHKFRLSSISSMGRWPYAFCHRLPATWRCSFPELAGDFRRVPRSSLTGTPVGHALLAGDMSGMTFHCAIPNHFLSGGSQPVCTSSAMRARHIFFSDP